MKEEARKEGVGYGGEDWIVREKEAECCKVVDFIECEEENREFYRNKTELTVGVSGVTGLPIFGFNCGDFSKR